MTQPRLEVGKVYKSLAGCPVKLLELVREMARVEYVDATNNYGYGQGAIGWFYAGDLTEWTEPTVTREDLRAAWLDGSLTLAQYAAAYNDLFPDDAIADWAPRWTDE